MLTLGTIFIVLWVICFVGGLWLDEDANHWTWPSDNGPGALATARIAGLSAIAAALLLGLLVGFGELVKYLATL